MYLCVQINFFALRLPYHTHICNEYQPVIVPSPHCVASLIFVVKICFCCSKLACRELMVVRWISVVKGEKVVGGVTLPDCWDWWENSVWACGKGTHYPFIPEIKFDCPSFRSSILAFLFILILLFPAPLLLPSFATSSLLSGFDLKSGKLPPPFLAKIE